MPNEAEGMKTVEELMKDLNGSAPAANQAPANPAAAAPAATGTTSDFTHDQGAAAGLSRGRSLALEQSRASGETPLGRMQMEFQNRAEICGYVTRSNEKVDFKLIPNHEGMTPEITYKEVRGKQRAYRHYPESLYELRAVQVPPTMPTGVIVVYPVGLYETINSGAQDMDTLDKAMANTKTWAVKILKRKAELPAFMNRYTRGVLFESKTIFDAYTTGGKNHQTYNDYYNTKVVRNSGNNGKPALLRTTSSSPDSPIAIIIVHSLHSRWVTPNNYIALNQFATESLSRPYSDEESSEYAMKYFKRFLGRRTEKTVVSSRLPSLVSAQAGLFDIKTDPNGKEIIASNEIFRTEGSALRGMTVDDWYERDSAGIPVKHPAAEMKFVSYGVSKDGNSVRAILRPMKSENTAVPDTYKFDPTCRVVQATVRNGQALLTYDILKEFEASLSKSTTKEGSSPRGGRLYGIQLGDLTSEQLQTIMFSGVSA